MPKHISKFAIPLLLVIYFLTHLPSLTALPVFADEAIYTRWAQLIIDDWQQYLFFPMNDGKTPLFMWLLVPFQFLFRNQLYAARFVSLLVGSAQVVVMYFLSLSLGSRKKTAWLASLLTILLPFWYFHHRMALIDGLLTLWLSLSLLGVAKLVNSPSNKKIKKKNFFLILATGIAFGLAMLTKIPALLVAPALPLFSFLPQKKTWQQRKKLVLQISISVGVGLFLFALLKLHPAFSQLFGRGSDFLYPWREVVFGGAWKDTIRQIPVYTSYFMQYLTLPVLILVIVGLFSSRKTQRLHHLLFLSALMFVGPVALLGKVVYPRYLFPASLFLTISAAFSVEDIVVTWVNSKKTLWKRSITGLIVAVFLANILSQSLRFITPSLNKADATPFVPADDIQYLTEWSSGHGISETYDLILDISKKESVAVATEGFFGTLPDALLMLFHRQDVSNMMLEGIGQPVAGIPDTFVNKAAKFDRKLLVVNDYRLHLKLPQKDLLLEVCRPLDGACLQVWDITHTLDSQNHEPS